jgi:antirestriction protein
MQVTWDDKTPYFNEMRINKVLNPEQVDRHLADHRDYDLRAWVGCLACYNAGHLVGHWYDADEAGDRTSADVHSSNGLFAGDEPVTITDGRDSVVLLPDGRVVDDLGCPHEELWVMDHEGFGDLLTGECSPCEAQRLAELVGDLDEDERTAFSSFAGNYSTVDDGVLDDFREASYGVWDSERDFAYSFAEETCVEGHDGMYFDWDSYTRDLFFDFTTHDLGGGRIFVTSDH